MYKHKYHKYKYKYELSKGKRGGNNIQMDYNTRIAYYNILHNNMKDIKDCLSTNPLLKQGGHAIIYKKTINKDDKKIDISLKEQKANKFILDNKFNKKNKIWLEYYILEECTKLVLNKVTQNLPLLYDINICDKEEKIIFYNELANGDFIDWACYDHSEEEWESFLFQFWIGLYTLQKHLKFVHNDLRLGNVLYHKIHKSNDYWNYNINNVDYYVPNEGYVFVIWDFGSANLIESPTDINKNKLDLNIDLHFFHDLYNRIRMILLFEKYTIDELAKFFVTPTELNYVKEKTNECTRRFMKTGRFEEKCKIALIYYLLETDQFDDLMKKSHIAQTTQTMKLPPKNIMNLLKELSDNNYNYDDVLKIIFNPTFKIKNTMSPPNILIEKYFSKYKVKHDYNLKFTV